MTRDYDRHSADSNANVAQSEYGGGPDDEAMKAAAQALRHAEVEAVQPNLSGSGLPQLSNMSIDELRLLAARLDVPDRGTIIDREELIAAIRQRM
jgi:hypothetical protein